MWSVTLSTNSWLTAPQFKLLDKSFPVPNGITAIGGGGRTRCLSSSESTQPTVPSPPQAMIRTPGTLPNRRRPSPGPPFDRSNTCRGFSNHWNLCINLLPWKQTHNWVIQPNQQSTHTASNITCQTHTTRYRKWSAIFLNALYLSTWLLCTTGWKVSVCILNSQRTDRYHWGTVQTWNKWQCTSDSWIQTRRLHCIYMHRNNEEMTPTKDTKFTCKVLKIDSRTWLSPLFGLINTTTGVWWAIETGLIYIRSRSKSKTNILTTKRQLMSSNSQQTVVSSPTTNHGNALPMKYIQ